MQLDLLFSSQTDSAPAAHEESRADRAELEPQQNQKLRRQRDEVCCCHQKRLTLEMSTIAFSMFNKNQVNTFPWLHYTEYILLLHRLYRFVNTA